MSLDRREFLAAAGTLCAVPAGLAPPPRLSVFVYTRPLIRARHRQVVADALEKRHEAHTSGWGNDRGRPHVAIGPVQRGAAHWRGDERIKNMDRAWPFVVVVEFPRAGGPQVWLDWFRRASSQHRREDGWLLDPGVGYAQHMNAQIVSGGDATTGLLACADTPTGTIVGGQEFALRARAQWADGSYHAAGWWMWFEAPKRVAVEDWFVERYPLSLRRRVDGGRRTADVEDPESELAVHNTERVFRFPRIPVGVRPSS